MVNINDLLKKIPKQNREGTPNELLNDYGALDTMTDDQNDYMQELEKQELADMSDQQKVAINRDGLPEQLAPIKEAKLNNINDKAESPYQKTKQELEQDNIPTKTPLQELLEKSNALREKSGLDMKAARESDKRKAMIANLSKAIGSLGAAKIQSDTGQKVGLEAFTPVKAEDSTPAIARERDNLLNQLQGEYRLMQEAAPKGITDFQQAQLEGAEKDRALKEKLARLSASSKKIAGKKITKLQEEREKNIADRYDSLQEQIPNATANIEEANFLIKQLDEGNISTGPGASLAGDIGSFFNTEESTIKQRLDSLAEKAARAQLKANGEVRPTDADVEGMKRAMFNLGNTEAANKEKLKSFIKQQQATINEYDQMKSKLEKGEGLEEFLLEPTYKKDDEPKIKTNEVKRRLKDGKIGIFNKDTKEFIRYE